MTDTLTVTRILNELLVEEQRSLPFRLLESTPFVSQLHVSALSLVNGMVRASLEHGAWLSELIADLGGSVGPRGTNPASADLHYEGLQSAFPRLLEDRELLVHVFSAAIPHVSAEPTAIEFVGRILSRHQTELEEIRQTVAGEPAGGK